MGVFQPWSEDRLGMCALVGACIGAVLQHCCTNIHVGPAHLRAGECVVHLYIHSKHTKQKKSPPLT